MRGVSTSLVRHDAPVGALLAVAAGCAGVGGILLLMEGPVALLYPLAVIVGIVVLVEPMVGVFLLTLTLPVENLLMTEGGSTATKLLGMLLFGSWVVNKIVRRESWEALANARLIRAAVPFAAWATASVYWARHPNVALGAIPLLLQLLALAMIYLDLIRSWSRADLVAKALVIGGLIAAAMTIDQFYSLGVRRAGDDIAGGINGTAIMLMTLIPFGFYLLRAQDRLLWQILGLAMVGSAVVSILLTFSRMNIILLVPLLLAMAYHTWRGRRGARLLLAVVALVGFASLVVIDWDRVIERTQTIMPYVAMTLGTGDESAPLSGRGYHLRVGVEMAQDNPVAGVGYHNYGRLFLQEYQHEVSGRSGLYYNPRSPHSSYIAIAAELGLVGLLIWAAVLLSVIANLVAAWKATRDSPDVEGHVFVQALAYSTALYIVAYSWYTPVHDLKIFWILMGLSVAARTLAQRDVQQVPVSLTA